MNLAKPREFIPSLLLDADKEMDIQGRGTGKGFRCDAGRGLCLSSFQGHVHQVPPSTWREKGKP